MGLPLRGRPTTSFPGPDCRTYAVYPSSVNSDDVFPSLSEWVAAVRATVAARLAGPPSAHEGVSPMAAVPNAFNGFDLAGPDGVTAIRVAQEDNVVAVYRFREHEVCVEQAAFNAAQPDLIASVVFSFLDGVFGETGDGRWSTTLNLPSHSRSSCRASGMALSPPLYLIRKTSRMRCQR